MAVKDERIRGKPDPAPTVRTRSGYTEEHPKGRREAVVGAEPVARDTPVPDQPPKPRKPKDAPT